MTFTGSVTTASGSGGGDSFNTNEEGKTTPKKMTFDKDVRSQQNGGTYPNYWSHKTRSGHNFIMDDSEGNESVTLQHRSGSAIQFKPDGGVLMTTHNGKYEVVFGENRVTISGAHDITVKGDTSMRVYGNHNVTVHGDHNMTVLGDHNVTAKNMNYSVRGNIDTEAKNINTRVEGSGTYNYLGALSNSSKGNMTHISTGGKMALGAATGMKQKVVKGNHVVHVEKGDTVVQGDEGKYSLKFMGSGTSGSQSRRFGIGAGGAQQMVQMLISAGAYSLTTTGGDIKHKTDQKYQVDSSDDIGFKSGQSIKSQAAMEVQTQSGTNMVHQVGSSYSVTAGSSAEVRAPSGSVNIAGQTTNVNALGGMLGIAGAAGVSVDSLGSMLNLNGGIASIASALGLQLNFDFLDTPSALSLPDFTGTNADQPTEEPDATGEIDSWL